MNDESERFSLQMVLRHAPIVLFATDAAGTITLSEGSGLTALGLRPGEAVGHNYREYCAGESAIGANTRRALAGEATAVEIQVLDCWIYTEFLPIRAADGSPAGVIGVGFDITRRRHAEEALRRSAQEQRQLAANFAIERMRLEEAQAIARIGSWEHDHVNGQLIWSPEIYRMFDRDPRDAAPTLETFFASVHPDDRTPLAEAYTEAIRNKTPYEITHRIVGADGAITHLHQTGRTYYDENGEPQRTAGTAQDVTAHRVSEHARIAAENEYRALFVNAVEGIFQSEPSGRLLQVNPALARIYGYDSPEQLLAALAEQSQSFYLDPTRRGEFQRLMREQDFVSQFESQIRQRDGQVIWISENARPVRDESGLILRYEGFISDISDRKALEEEKARALREAQERADLDPLTGLLNHRAFYHLLDEAAACARSNDSALAIVMLDLDNFKFFNDVYGHATGDGVLRVVADRLRSIRRSDCVLARFGGDEFALLLPNFGHATAEQIELWLRVALDGIHFEIGGDDGEVPVSISLGAALYSSQTANCHEVLREADERLRWSKTAGDVADNARRLRADTHNDIAGFSMLDALVTAVDNRDRYTRRHSDDVMEYSLLIARELGFDEEEQRVIALSALLHDVGKIGVPDAILRKPGALTAAEFEAIKQHPTMGAIMIQSVPGLEGTIDAVRYHHERWDGLGYPAGLRGTQCPPHARLLAVADSFSAMTTDRPYRRGMDKGVALELLREGAGAQWDPDYVRAFLSALSPRKGRSILRRTNGYSALRIGAAARAALGPPSEIFAAK